MIPTHQPVILSKVEIYRSATNKDSRKRLAERLLSLWRADSIVVQTQEFIFREQGTKSGKIITIIPRNEALVLANSILETTTDEGNEFEKLKKSVITETINIIGNAFIGIVAHRYGWSIRVGVPILMNAPDFDVALISLVSAENETYRIAYQCELRINSQPVVLYLFIFI